MRWLLWVVAALAIGGAGYYLLDLRGKGASDPFGSESDGEGAGEALAGPLLHGAAGETLEVAEVRGTYRVVGTVLDAAGKPVAGVPVGARRTGTLSWDAHDPRTWGETSEETFRKSVSALDAPARAAAPWDEEAATGEDGKFQLPLALPGTYLVQARPGPPRLSSTAHASLTRNAPSEDVTLTLREGTPLLGRVVEGSGASERGVAAEVKASATLDDGTTWSAGPVVGGEDGSFRFDALPKGPWRLEVRVPGRLTLGGVAVTMPHEGVFVVRLAETTGRVVGTVRNPKQAPVEGATVLLTLALEEAGTTATVRALTAADGAYRIDAAPPGKVTSASAHAERHAVHRSTPPLAPWSGAAVTAGGETRLDLVLEIATTVEGRVLEAGTGAGIPDADVFVALGTGRGGSSRPLATKSSADGSYRIEGVPAGRALLAARGPRHYLKSLADETMGDGSPYMAPMPDGRQGGQAGPPPDLVLVAGPEGGTIRRDIVLHPGLAVRGKVVDASGRPVEGAEVRSKGVGTGSSSWRWGVNVPGGMDLLGTSAADGSFEARPLPPSDALVLYARKAPFVGGTSEPFALGSGAPPPEVVLKLEAGAVLAGKVLDPEGGPVAAVDVNVWGQWMQGTSGRTWCRSDAGGAWRLEGIPPGRCTLNLRTQRFRSVQMPIEALGPGEVREGIEVRLEPGVRVSGTVVDGDGKPLARRQLMLYGQEGGGGWQNTTTDADGAFEFANAPKGRVQMQIQPGEDGVWTGLTNASFEAPATGLRLVAATQSSGSVLEGVVLDAGGARVPLCRVWVQGKRRGGEGPMYFGGGGQDPNECVHGSFRRLVTGKGPWSVTASGARDERGRPLNLRSKTVDVASADEPVEIRLEGGAEVAGTVVTREGRGVANAFVSTPVATVRTEESGAFCVGGLEEGDTTVTVFPPRGMVTPAPTKARAGARDLRIEVESGLPIAGSVLDADGQPAVNGNVNATWQATNRAAEGQKAAQLDGGRFRLEGIPEGVLVTLLVQTWNPTGGGSMAPLRLEGVAPGTTNLALRLERGLAIAGVLVDADGKPFTRAWINVAAEDGQPTGGGFTQVQSDGTFRVEGLKPGEYRVQIQRQDNGPPPEALRVQAPTTGLKIQMPRGEKIAGRLLGGGDLGGFQVMAYQDGNVNSGWRMGGVSPDGSFSVDGIGSGTYTLMARKDGDDRYGLVTGVAPGTTNAAVDLQRGQSIEGVVEVDGGGAPERTFVNVLGPSWRSWARPAADGAFAVRGLPPGRYQLSVHGEGATVTEDDVAAGTTGVRLRLSRK